MGAHQLEQLVGRAYLLDFQREMVAFMHGLHRLEVHGR